MRLLLVLAAAVAVSQSVPLYVEWMARSAEAEQTHDIVVLLVDLDNPAERTWPTHLRVRLRPDLSAASCAFIRAAARAGCGGRLYRDEPRLLVQGKIDCAAVITVTEAHRDAMRLQRLVEKGPCPAGATLDPNRKCVARDPDCGCHGPIVTRGMVGWASGGAGPDFFVYTGARPAEQWAHDYTVFGEVADDASLAALERLHALPAKDDGGMRVLEVPLLMRVTEASDPESTAGSPADGAL
jgi:hypothetical protein